MGGEGTTTTAATKLALSCKNRISGAVRTRPDVP
jgi:hypothetical protein